MEFENEVLVGVAAELLAEFARDGVAPAAHLDDLTRVEAQRLDDGEPRAARRRPAVHRHVHALDACAEEALVAVPLTVKSVRREPVAWLALLGMAEGGRDAKQGGAARADAVGWERQGQDTATAGERRNLARHGSVGERPAKGGEGCVFHGVSAMGFYRGRMR